MYSTIQLSVAQWDLSPAAQNGNPLTNAPFFGFLESSVSLVYVPAGASWDHILSKSFVLCFWATDPNTANHGQSAFLEEETASAKAQRYDRACFVWRPERS